MEGVKNDAGVTLEIDKARIPRVVAICGNDAEEVSNYLGVQLQYISALLGVMGLKLGDVPDDKLRDALVLQAETAAETVLSALRVAGTSFGKELENA